MTYGKIGVPPTAESYQTKLVVGGEVTIEGSKVDGLKLIVAEPFAFGGQKPKGATELTIVHTPLFDTLVVNGPAPVAGLIETVSVPLERFNV